MKQNLLIVDGERYLRVDAVGEVFDVQVTWIEETFEYGLLERCEIEGPVVCVRVTEMDKVANLIRLRLVYELDWESVALYLDG